MQDFEKLKVWQMAHELVLGVYRATKSLPNDERYGLTSQIRRAAVSVAANIVEGAKRLTGPDYARFLNIAEGSMAETRYLLIVARDLDYIEKDLVSRLTASAVEIEKMLHGLRTRVEERDS